MNFLANSRVLRGVKIAKICHCEQIRKDLRGNPYFAGCLPLPFFKNVNLSNISKNGKCHSFFDYGFALARVGATHRRHALPLATLAMTAFYTFCILKNHALKCIENSNFQTFCGKKGCDDECNTLRGQWDEALAPV